MSINSLTEKFPKSVQEFAQERAKWQSGISTTKSKQLLKALDVLAKNADFDDAIKDPAYFSSKIIYELNVRKLKPEQEEKLSELTKKIKHSIKGFLMSGRNVAETCRIKIFNKKRHIYPSALESVFEKWKKKDTEKNFAVYVEKKCRKEQLKELKESSVKYLSEKERNEYIVSFKKNGLVHQNNKPLLTGAYIFALDLENKHIYAAPKEKGRFHHSSFLAGAPVKCAGRLGVKDGKLLGFTLDSGHYRPDDKGVDYLREHLKKKTELKAKAKHIPIYTHRN